ncbi:MAG: PilZ domain-containing protein [Bacteriovoracaceae bacterium]
MIKKLLKVIFLSDKRKANRDAPKKIKNVLVFFMGKSFHVANISSNGIGIMDQGQMNWIIGQDFHGEIEIFMSEKAKIRGRVVRIKDKIIGIEFFDISSDYRNLVKKLKQK